MGDTQYRVSPYSNKKEHIKMKTKYYSYAKLKKFLQGDLYITMKNKCRFRNKTVLFNSINDLDFKKHYKMSMEYLNNIIRSCSETCGENKCFAYRNYMQDVAKKYREEVNSK